MAKTTSIVFVLYDGIEHSVFEGQVLDPLLKKLARDKELTATLLSFEKTYPPKKKLLYLNKRHPRLQIKFFRKTFFLGWPSLVLGAQQLRSYLRLLTAYELITRGPLAGIIAQKALTQKCKKLTVQARGLLAEEHRFSYTPSFFLLRWIYLLRTKQLAYWEQRAYTYQPSIPFTIETVSSALTEHLITRHNLSKHIFSSYQLDDIPTAIKIEQRTTLRTTLRRKLKINDNQFVYVYNGSAKPWQCPTETVIYFKNQLKNNPNAFLLLLTTDIKIFKKICRQQKLPLNTYKIVTLSHKNVLSYLCTADQGILLRQKNIINWVSRPTKYLEYKAAGLSVIHNHTVAFIEQEG